MENIAKEAAGTLSQTQWGALLVLSWIVFGIVLFIVRKDLKAEQVAHQTTRLAYIAVLESKGQIASGILTLQDAQKEQNALLMNLISNQRRA